MRTKWIELKDFCEQYLEKKDSITSTTDMITLLEILGSYMLFGESMCSEPTEEEKKEDQMKAEKMLKLVQDGEACSAEINETVMEMADESEVEAVLDEFDRELAENVNALPPAPTTMPGGNGKE